MIISIEASLQKVPHLDLLLIYHVKVTKHITQKIKEANKQDLNMVIQAVMIGGLNQIEVYVPGWLKNSQEAHSTN